ncbi:MAG: hypothetical protein K0R18_206 [Bacillales bacterium]|jgi:hypothetical protein|nr:hypothetical protein [Bacillales bacterium]
MRKNLMTLLKDLKELKGLFELHIYYATFYFYSHFEYNISYGFLGGE